MPGGLGQHDARSRLEVALAVGRLTAGYDRDRRLDRLANLDIAHQPGDGVEDDDAVAARRQDLDVDVGVVPQDRDLVRDDLLKVVILARLQTGDAGGFIRNRDELDLVQICRFPSGSIRSAPTRPRHTLRIVCSSVNRSACRSTNWYGPVPMYWASVIGFVPAASMTDFGWIESPCAWRASMLGRATSGLVSLNTTVYGSDFRERLEERRDR